MSILSFFSRCKKSAPAPAPSPACPPTVPVPEGYRLLFGPGEFPAGSKFYSAGKWQDIPLRRIHTPIPEHPSCALIAPNRRKPTLKPETRVLVKNQPGVKDYVASVEWDPNPWLYDNDDRRFLTHETFSEHVKAVAEKVLSDPIDNTLDHVFHREFGGGQLYQAAATERGVEWVKTPCPKYSAQFELVLPFLESWQKDIYRFVNLRKHDGKWNVTLKEIVITSDGLDPKDLGVGADSMLAKAAVLALLASRGWKITFSQK